MARKRIGLEFEGFEEVISRLNKLNGGIKSVTEKALKESQSLVNSKAKAAIEPHRLTGKTEKSLSNVSEVEWQGTTASIKVGFNISSGGLASIFLMYGTPRMKKDQKLYNAFYGKSTQKEIENTQKEIFYDAIRRLEE